MFHFINDEPEEGMDETEVEIGATEDTEDAEDAIDDERPSDGDS